MKSIKRFLDPPESNFFLFGPRGTGKSTFLKQTFPDAKWINLLDPEVYRSYSARPERLLELVRKTREHTQQFVIDEVQRIPEILSSVHLLIEEDKSTLFALTGSSSRKLKRSGVDLLAGRALLRTLHPFMAGELGELFNIDDALTTGTIPLVASDKNPSEKLKSYVAVYLQEEVKYEGLTRNIGDFSHFLEIISFSHGAEINSSNIGRECGIGRKTVDSYLSILEDLLIAFTIPAFVKKTERSSYSHPKFYFADAGIYRSLRPAGTLDRPEEILGAALEGLVAQHIRGYLAYQNSDAKLYFWRTYNRAEVDFVIYGSDIFLAIEVKNASRIRTEDLRGLSSFSTAYPQAKLLLLYRGTEYLKINTVNCVPVDMFLLNLNPLKIIPV